jgi:crotonobetainyl-CoA:carnitine CoA-transferase CaiB-like acyl-CoA transferase
MFNANKKSVTINLKTPRGLEIVRELLKKADVTVENMAPGTIERLGLGYDAVRQLNPGIIYCQVKGFGEGSPYEHGLAFDMIAQAAGGPISVTGEPGRPPVKPGPSFGDTGTGMLMAITLLGALYNRQITGQGRRLQVAMQDAMVHYMRTCFSTQARPRQSSAAPRPEKRWRQQCALRPLSLQARRAKRLRVPYHEPSQPRTLAASNQVDWAGRAYRRPAVRYWSGAIGA